MKTFAEKTLVSLKTDVRNYLDSQGRFSTVTPYTREDKIQTLRNELALMHYTPEGVAQRSSLAKYTNLVQTPLHPAIARNDDFKTIKDAEIESLRLWILTEKAKQQDLLFLPDIEGITKINEKGASFHQSDNLSLTKQSVNRQILLAKVEAIIDASTLSIAERQTKKTEIRKKHSPLEMYHAIESLVYLDPVEVENNRLKEQVKNKLDRVMGSERKEPLLTRYNEVSNLVPFSRSELYSLETDINDRINGNSVYADILILLDELPSDDSVITSVKQRIPSANAVALNRIKTDLLARRREIGEEISRKANEEKVNSRRTAVLTLAEQIADLELKGNFIVELNDANSLTAINSLENRIRTEIGLNSLRQATVSAIHALPDDEALKQTLRRQERASYTDIKLRDIKARAETRKQELDDDERAKRQPPRTPVPVRPREPKVPIVKKYIYDEDITGASPANLIRNERHTVTPENRTPQNVLLPAFAPFYRASLVVTDMQTGIALQEGIDYTVEWPITWADADIEGYKALYLGIQFIDDNITGQFELEYQTLGGQWAIGSTEIAQALANQASDPLTTTYDNILGRPIKLPH